jgi:hypothetical protein
MGDTTQPGILPGKGPCKNKLDRSAADLPQIATPATEGNRRCSPVLHRGFPDRATWEGAVKMRVEVFRLLLLAS